MSKPRFWWWKDVKNALRQYPIWVQEWEELKTVSVTPNYSAIGHGSGISNPTEQVALRLLPKRKQEWFDAIRDAVAETERKENGTDIMKVIRLRYWAQSHTLAGAAMTIPIEEQTAKIWNGDFIRLIGVYYGYLTREEYEQIIKARNRKNVPQSQKNEV